jgi:hypothetical protein
MKPIRLAIRQLVLPEYGITFLREFAVRPGIELKVYYETESLMHAFGYGLTFASSDDIPALSLLSLLSEPLQ